MIKHSMDWQSGIRGGCSIAGDEADGWAIMYQSNPGKMQRDKITIQSLMIQEYRDQPIAHLKSGVHCGCGIAGAGADGGLSISILSSIISPICKSNIQGSRI